jgi:hypothetical protein
MIFYMYNMASEPQLVDFEDDSDVDQRTSGGACKVEFLADVDRSLGDCDWIKALRLGTVPTRSTERQDIWLVDEKFVVRRWRRQQSCAVQKRHFRDIRMRRHFQKLDIVPVVKSCNVLDYPEW